MREQKSMYHLKRNTDFCLRICLIRPERGGHELK